MASPQSVINTEHIPSFLLKLSPLLLVICTSNFAAEFYQCKNEKGHPVFTQTPCSEDAQLQFVNEPSRKSEATLLRLANE